MAFQSRLFDALSDLETNGLAHIASWQPHGCCFQIHKPNLFTKLVLPRWFGQTKWSSFERQLTIFGFARIDFGRDKGSYYHPHFQRGQPMRVNDMQRMSVRRNGLHVRSALPLPLTPPALDGLSALSVRQSHSTTSKLSVNAARILSERATTTTPSKASCKRAGIDRDARIVPKSPQPPPRQLNSCTLLVEYLKREQIAHERVQRRHLAEVERLLKRNPPIVRTTDKHYLCRQVKDLQRFVAQQRQGRRRRHSPTGSDTHQLDDGRRTAATLPLARPWSNLAVSTMQVISECLMWLRGITRQRPKR